MNSRTHIRKLLTQKIKAIEIDARCVAVRGDSFKRWVTGAEIERRIRFAYCGHANDDAGDDCETPTVEDMAEELKAFPRYQL